MTFGSSSVMGGCVSTGSVFLRGELAHRSPRALDGVDRYGAYRVALRVGRFIANAAGAGLVAVGLVPDFPAEARWLPTAGHVGRECGRDDAPGRGAAAPRKRSEPPSWVRIARGSERRALGRLARR